MRDELNGLDAPQRMASGSADRRRFLLNGAAISAAALGAATIAQSAGAQPTPHSGAGPIRPGRDTRLQDKIAVVTGAARGIGRAIAVEMAANGADIVAVDICGFVSTASNAKPATPEDLEETARQVRGYERRCIPIKADIRNIGQLRQIAAQTKQEFWTH
jgi:hypothetical protein